MSCNSTHDEPKAHFTTNATKSPTRGILQKSYDYEAHETPEHKIKWDENKLKVTEKQKEQVQMKVNEPNTPFIRYDPVTNKVMNLEVLPESLREGANEDPGDFDLGISHHGESGHISQQGINEEPDEWQKVDEKEKQDKEEAAQKRHEEFERKRAQHYYHAGDVMHQKLSDDED